MTEITELTAIVERTVRGWLNPQTDSEEARVGELVDGIVAGLTSMEPEEPRPRRIAEAFAPALRDQPRASGRLRPTREDVWLDTYTAAITGLCSGKSASEIIRGDQVVLGEIPDVTRGEQRRREICGAAGLIANRAVLEWALHWPGAEADSDSESMTVGPDFEGCQCPRFDAHPAHVTIHQDRPWTRCPGLEVEHGD